MEPRASTALSAVGLAALRRAAVMAHTVGTISLRLTAGDERIVDVRPHPAGRPRRIARSLEDTLGSPGRIARSLEDTLGSPRTVDPCSFRMAVARAWTDHEMGREIGFVGRATSFARPGTRSPHLGPSDALDIEWSVAAPGQDLGLGAVRAVCAGRVVWAFASVLEPAELSEVMAEIDGDPSHIVAGASDGVAARLVHDELLGATVVHVEADPASFARAARTPVSTRVLDEVLRCMVAVVGAAELTKELA